MTEKQLANQLGRNEPCPCGSGKKYKRCCGVGASPKLGTATPNPNLPSNMSGMSGMPGGMDPSQMDPAMMQQFSQMLSRLPKGQLQRLQNLMTKAMAGKDVSREAQEFEHSLPVEFQSMLQSFQPPGSQMSDRIAEMTPSSEPLTEPMNEDEARRIVEDAAKKGTISSDEAAQLLSKPKGISKLWKKR